MPDPIGANSLIQGVLDAYRIFLQEMRNIRMEKKELIKTVINRVDLEKTNEVRSQLKNIEYEK